MEFLESVPYIFRILLSLFAILLFQKATKRLDAAMLCGILLLSFWIGHTPASIAGVALRRLATPDTLCFVLIITGVIWLSELMSRAGLMKELVQSLKPRLSKRAILAVLPALVGLLPMPGGALFSCPLVDDADGEDATPPELKTEINYWFRHVWEFWWPLYPGFLLAADVSGLPVWKLGMAMAPLSLGAIGAGWFFLLRKTRGGERERRAADAPPRPFLPLIFPILTVIGVYAFVLAALPPVGEVSGYLPMLTGVAASLAVMQWMRPNSPAAWKSIVFSGKWMSLVAIVVLARVYGAFIEGELPGGGGALLMERVRGELNAYGIPAVLLIVLVPFVSGLTTGLTIGYIGASFPIVLSLGAGETGRYFSAIVLGYGCGFIGMMLSPIHVCLIVTNQYFKTSLGGSLAALSRPALALFGFAAAYAFLWWSLFS